MAIIVPTTSFSTPTTAGDQINGALRLIGQLAEGETPSPETSADSLMALTPVALHLLGNPLVRSMALRLLMRQLTSRLPG